MANQSFGDDSSFFPRETATGDGWCDDEFGWGPFVENTNTLTLCFCATVFELPLPILLAILGIPSLYKVSQEPFVNPASSVTFSFKLGLSAIAMFCSMLLGMFSHPASTANTWAQSLTAAGWLLSILMLVAGYLRAQPQLFLLRLWWVTQFLSDSLVFANHSTLNPSESAHMIRGISLVCALLLVLLSYYRRDVPKYQAIVAPSSNGTMTSFRSPANGSDTIASGASVTTPLLMPRMSLDEGRSPVREQRSGRYGMVSQLSQMTLYGADTSVFKGAISAWDEAVSSSYKAQSLMSTATGMSETDGEEDEVVPTSSLSATTAQPTSKIGAHLNGNGHADS